jgi:uncharacterized membrane protein
MPKSWQSYLQRWKEAGLIDPEAAERIKALEIERDQRTGHRWPVLLAWIFGGVMVCAGVLLFVAAHWDQLSPAMRFSMVLMMVAVFHLSGAFLSANVRLLSQVLHAIGTITLGAGIFLTGQIFHLQEHWPGGVMLWAAGAWLAWFLLRHAVQIGLAAILTPIWLVGEWLVATEHMTGGGHIPAACVCLLALVYFTARTRELDTKVRRILTWIGGISLVPATFWVVYAYESVWRSIEDVPTGLLAVGWIVALGGPLCCAYMLRRRDAWPAVAGAAWVVLLTMAAGRIERGEPELTDWYEIAIYALCAIASCLLALWGLKDARRERINLGVLGFGLTVVFFYFGSVMDKLGRSVSLLILGLLFLIGGFLLERARRKLISKMEGSAS